MRGTVKDMGKRHRKHCYAELRESLKNERIGYKMAWNSRMEEQKELKTRHSAGTFV